MSGLGQNIHLLHCAAAVRAGGGSVADWGAMMHLQWHWCQNVRVQPRTVKTIKSGCMELRHKKNAEILKHLYNTNNRGQLKHSGVTFTH